MVGSLDLGRPGLLIQLLTTFKAYIPLRRKTIRVGYWHWLGHTFGLPNAIDTNMLVSFVLGDANLSRHLTQNPQQQSVEYRLGWVPNANFLRWPCTFHIFCVAFICIG